MVVDDDPDTRFVTSGLLGGDFETVQAENGLDALEKIDRYEPDLMLVDIAMPVMDGFATCRNVRRHDEFSDMPVFFLTGYASDEARRKAEEAGCHAYFEKPFDTGDLVDRIQAFFAEHHQPPREKMFSLTEIKKIDATPLRVVESEEESFEEEEEHERAQGALADTNAPGITPPRPTSEEADGEAPVARGGITHKRRRKTLGSVAKTELETQKPSALEPTGESDATPPADPAHKVDVGSVLDKLKAFAKEEDEKQEPPQRPEVPEELRQTRELPRPEAAEDKPISPSRLHERPALDRLRELDEQEEAERRRREALSEEPPTRAIRSPFAPKPAETPKPPSLQPPSARPSPREERPSSSPTPSAKPPAPSPAPESVRPAAKAPSRPAPATPARAIPAPLRPRRPIPAGAKKSSGGAGKARPRVLCLIDTKTELMAYTEALKGLGEFLPLEDPVEAVAIIARFQPDVVVMHIVGTAYSGLQLAQMLQSNPRLAHIEVIFVFTGQESPAQLKAAERLSSNRQLRSPVTANFAREVFLNLVAKPSFKVRAKKLAYGVYVDEVLKTIRDRKEEVRKEKEREFFEEKHEELVAGIKDAMKQVSPGLQLGERSKKDLQAYYLEA
ncbi:MAG: hypothetical protein PWP23_2114 [Candidatus Sumerlaeota bacterium]|nr:hypothetical protein [Candidatus Sumerlaeota bacterium]